MFALPVIDIPAAYVHPAGSLQIWGTDTPPDGWLLCYGQAVSRTTYADLFAIIGTVFGVGDGSTTFNLPDLRGRMPLGKDNMGGVSADRVTHANADSIGGVEGEENHTLSTAELAVHKHGLKGDDGGSGSDVSFENVGHSRSDNDAVQNAGSGNAHNNMSPYLTTAYIVKT
ncbi:hypothetical protein ES703_26025 [subsurface metagenome]